MLIILLACLFLVANSGHISPQDLLISPNNKNSPSQITLIFTLETSLAPTDYLRIVFPFKLNSLQPGGWEQYVDCSLAGPDKLATITASGLASDTNAYFVQFYTDDTPTTLSGLAANLTYYLRVNGVPDSSSQTGINLPVQLYTVSNNLQNDWIVYDSNPAFGTLTLADPFPSTMTVVRTIPSTEVNKDVLGATYKVNIDITPKTTLRDRARIDISLTDAAFTLLSCQSLNSTAEKIPLLPATFTPLSTSSIRATISQTLTAGNGAKYRFQCQVRNPTLPGTARISVQNRYGYIETITESGTDSQGIQATATSGSGSSSGWDETAHQVLLGWGYPASSPTALGIFSLYKDASATERWYQSVKTIFKPKVDLTTTQKLQVLISTVNDAGFKILAASIFHNLPDYSLTEKVTCSVLVQGSLTCQNVGQLQATAYFVSFKFNLQSTTSTSSVADFGKVSVQTQAASPVILIPLSLTTLTNKAIAVNVPLFSTAANGIIATSTPTATPGTTTTYVTNGEDVILNFGFRYFTTAVVPLSTFLINRGIEFYTSQSLATQTTVDCFLQTDAGLVFDASDVLISDCSVQSLTSFTRLRFRLARFNNVSPGSKAVDLFQTTQTGKILFNKVNFGSYSSLNYVNENVFDYYARWVQDFTDTNPTIVTVSGSSPFFFNSLVYKNGGLSSLNVGSTFFTTGATAADAANDGVNFPTLIRITGQLTPTEQSGANRLILFFNDLVPLDTNNPCFGPTGITCTYNVNGIDNTQTNTLTDYSGSSRIVIDTDLTSLFNIYIPVKTIASKNIIGFFIATATEVSTEASNQGIFATKHSKRVAISTYTATSTTVNAASGSTPQVSIPVGTAMGATINPSITNVGATYVPNGANTGSLIGAAYGYCADYNFATNSGFHLQNFPPSPTAAQSCVTMTYSPNAVKTVTCNICPVHSAMSAPATLTTNAWKMPTLAGADFYNLVYVVGNNDGNFRNAAYDNQANTLIPFTLSTIEVAFVPQYLKKGSNNHYVSLSFTVTSPLPKKIQINLTPNAPSTSLYITPVTSVSCKVTSLAYTSCATSGTATNIQIDAVAQSTGWSDATTHTIEFMVNNDASAISGNTTVNYMASIKVDGTTALPTGAIHHQTSTAHTFEVTDVAQDYIILSNITYLFGNWNARSIISFAFELPADIIVYSQQQIVFDLGGIAPANVGETPGCLIRDPVTLEVLNDFAVCDTSDLTTLILQPKDTVQGAYILELGFIKIPSSAAPAGISCQVIAVDGSTVVSESDPVNKLTLPTSPSNTLIPAINVEFQRLYADPGSVSEIVLKIQPSVLPINLQSNLYIYFPSYYPGKLGFQNIWCTAADLPVSCFVIAQRIMQLTSFPVEVQTTERLTIKIYGVITPVVPVPAGRIFIGLDSDADMFTLTEQLEINDVASNSIIPNPLWIDRFSVSSTLIRVKADHTIVFTTDAIGVRANRMIVINYPDRYGSILRGQEGPKIAISRTGSTVVTQVQSISFGSRFKILLPLNLDPLTSYTFVIQQIDNPDYQTCKMDRPVISVTDSTQIAATSRSAPNIWNALGVSYVSNPVLKTLTWADADGNPLSALTLSIGIFSKIIKILPPTGEKFNNDMTFTISQAAISVLPGILTATRGSPYLTLKIGASSASFPRILLLRFNKDESTTSSVYAELPKLEIILTNNKQVLPVPKLRIMRGGTSLPYQWKLDSLGLIPYSELKIICSINQASLSPLSLIGPSVITFGPTTSTQGFTFDLSSAADAANPPSFVLSIGGEDAANYMFINGTVEVEVLNPATTTPIFLALTITPNYAPNTQEFIVTMDQISAVYWHVAYQNSLSSTDCERVRSRFSTGNLYESQSTNQAQYGVFYIQNENEASPQLIGNLLSSQAYSYILCPVNQLDEEMGAATTGTFTTKDNLAILNQVDIQFSQAITRNQLTTLVCLFNTELQLPNFNVVAMDGTSCTTPSIFDSFDSFSYTTVTIYIYGDRSSEFDSVTSTLLNQYVTSIQTQTPSDFLTAFNQALRAASLTSLYQAITLQVGPTYTLPVIDSSSLVTAISTDTTITIDGLKLSSGEGVFYAIASTSTSLPTALQVKARLQASGTTVSGANVIYNTGEVSLTLTNLTPETTYTVYYFASNADRTQYSRVTAVEYIQSTTEKAKTVSASRVEMNLLFSLIVGFMAWLL